MSPDQLPEHDPAAAYARALADGLRYEFALDPLDRVGVPVWSTWWQRSGGHVGGIGYASTYGRARIGALGETAEHVFALAALVDRTPVEGSYAELVRTLGAGGVVDPRLLGLTAGVAYDEHRPLQWFAMRRWRAGSGTPGEEVLVPAEFVASSDAELPAGWPGGDRLAVPVSNGLGAGSSPEQAVGHGLLEILQRDGNGLTFRALDRGVVLDVAAPGAVRDPGTLDALGRLRAAGVDVLVKLGAIDFGLPNLYVVGSAPDDDVVVATACGEAVHPDREVALRKAVLEFASARARKRFMHGPLDAVAEVAPAGYLDTVLPQLDPADEEQRVLDAMVGWLQATGDDWRERVGATVFSRRTTLPLADVPTTPGAGSGGAGELLADVHGRLAAEGYDVLVADLSPADGPSSQGGVHVAKVVVPGLEVETVAYARLGERNARRLLEGGRDDLVRVGDRPPGWSRVHLADDAEQRLGGPAWLDRAALARVAGDLLPLYREPSRHTAQQVLVKDFGPPGGRS